MDNSNIKLTTFDTKPSKVVCAEYKDSIYYLLNGKCINSSVWGVHGSLTDVDVLALQNVVNVHLEENPDDDVIYVPEYKLTLLDDDKTTAIFVEGFCRDILGFTRKQCQNVVNELNSEKHECEVGTFTYEIVTTLVLVLQNGNYQYECNLGSRIDEVPRDHKFMLDTNLALQSLIQRDYPEDL